MAGDDLGGVTRCPVCQTSFRVTSGQLEAAGGKVRCGACLQVFLAADHLLPGHGAPVPAPSRQSDVAVGPEAPNLMETVPESQVREASLSPAGTSEPAVGAASAGYREPSAEKEPSAQQEPSA